MKPFKILTLFFTAFLLFAPIAIAKTASVTNESLAARYPFYLAQKGETKIYILGTMHLGRIGDSLNPKIDDALNSSSKLILEISPNELNMAEEELKLFLCEKPCLRDQIGEALFEQLKAKYRLLALGSGNFEQTPAWFVSSLISVYDYLKMGYSPNFGSEKLLQKIAPQIETVGLESGKEQLNSMATLSNKAQREMLEDYLSMDDAELKGYIKEMYDIYLAGDADRLFNWYMRDRPAQKISKESISEFNEKLIFERNKRFVTRLKKHMTANKPIFERNKRFVTRLKKHTIANKPIFIAVGALHLGGEKGVLALLRKDGYKITAIK
ncbi:MAG: TraB/GumN family protein [Helicobacteraceae bacterium]|jgi:uncharacterized protein YbaP (TraB family)|nr:TraB/GumN family protein [Helicobacteraceae bacterium]